MSLIPTITITPSSAADAYGKVSRGDIGGASGPASGSFDATLKRALETAVDTGHKADAHAMRAISGQGNLTDVVTALSQAELTLQTATAVRDRVVQAYQDIIRMPI